MPALMARICGICPVSHLVASAKAGDALMAVEIPPAAILLRRVLNLAQIVQSHALSLFHLSSPDLLLGMDADPSQRNLFGLLRSHPDLARDGIALRRFGQQIIETLAGKRVHPSWVVPGGVSAPLDEARRAALLATVPDALARLRRVLPIFKQTFGRFEAEIASFASFPTLFLALVDDQGEIDYYDGSLRVVDEAGAVLADLRDPAGYPELIGEASESWSYLKSAYYRPLGYPDGLYRVGPLARLQAATGYDTPLAAAEWAEFRRLAPEARRSSFYYHLARLIEMLHATEQLQRLLERPEILDSQVRAQAPANYREGIGIAEAPRGTLLHHYQVDQQGLIVRANLIIATGHNNLAMNRGVLQTARRFVSGSRLEQGLLNRVEAVIRAFDPCLSCSTHAVGRMPLRIELRSATGVLLDALTRDQGGGA
jgi:NAD-reducing hydrogenase large subunit